MTSLLFIMAPYYKVLPFNVYSLTQRNYIKCPKCVYGVS